MPNLNPEAAFESLKGQVAATIKAQFPFEGAVRRLELVDVVFEEKSGNAGDPHHIDNLDEQLKARTTGMTWGVPVRGRLRLVDKASGHLIEEASVTLAKLPKITRRYSYLIDGQERQHDSVFRSKSRAYHRIASNGDVQARWNLARGHGFDLTYDPVKGRMIMTIGDSNIPLYSVLHILNVGDASMERAWGPEVFRDNQKAAKLGDVDKIYTALRLRMADRSSGTPAQRAEKIREYFATETEVLPDAMKAAFGREYSSVNGENLLLSSTRLLDIQKGRSKEDPPAHELPDDRQALSAKYLATTEDFVIEALRSHEASLRKQVQDRIDKPEYSISDIMSPNSYGRVVLAPFQHAQRPEQTNPLQFLSGYMRTTIRGKEFGGVGGEKINLDVEKELNPTHLGFIDPIQTPEGEDTGIALNLPLGISVTRATARPGSKSRGSPGQEIRTKVYDVKARQTVLATPAELEHAVVAYPDQVRWTGGHPAPIANEVVCYDEQRKTSKRPWEKVRYVLPSAKALLSFSANLIPFLQNNNGNRAMMAAKQQEQALALVRREAPLVQVKTDGVNTFEQVVGSFVTHTAPAAGVVKRVEPGAVHLQTEEGLVRIPMYNHFPLNGGKNSLHSIPVVKAGQAVQKGELLADSNYTKDGALALGSNLRVAYVPWKGLTFEDGIVVSESAAKRMSSDHMHALEVTVYASMIGATEGSLSRWRDYATPQRSTPEHISNLDARGIVREGAVVHSGDVLVAILSPRQSSESDQAAGLIHKTLARSYRDSSLVWDHDYSGKVVRVLVSEAMNRKHITVHVTTEQPLVVGDKLSGRHGNKGIISRIVQDHEMPHTADGVPADLLLNPAGVPSRMNVGQVLETAASKIAEKTGKPYIVENFVPGVDYSAKVTAEMQKHGLSDTEEMFDPVTKRSIGQIMVGKQYMLKLHHQVEKKATARSMESGYTHTGEAPKGSGIPGGGQKMDMLTTYAMLAHGANHNLREAYTFKSDGDQNAAWAAVITGNPLPPPQPTRGMSHFQNYLRALGVNVEKRKDDYQLSPLTDMHLLGDAKRGLRGISNGEIKLPEKLSVARGARTVEEHGGLFDPRVTGGLQGKFWSHVELAERMPSPLFEPAIQTLTGLTKKQFDAMVGEKGLVDGKSGFHTIIERLGAINVDEELKKAQAEVGKSGRATLNRAMKKVRYLEALKANGLTPLEAYTNKYLPVLPPSVRRVSVGLDGTQVVDDRNPLYLGVGHANGILKEAKPSTPHEDLQKARASLYSSIRSLRMTGMTTSPGSGKPRHMQGLMELLSGKTEDHGAPKESFFQEGVLARRQDLSGRSTIVPEPALGLDQVGVPRQIAMEMYKPFVVRELVRGGKTPIEALKWAKEKKDHPQVMDALERAVAERPVFLKRDPSLHKFSIMAFHPKIVEGSAIKIHPLVTGGFNADFDGDCYYGQVLVDTEEGVDYHEGMPHYLRVPGQKVIHIRDFPRIESTRVEKASGVVEYDVPAGVRVPACFRDGNRPCIESFEVTKFSEHPDCEEWVVKTRAGRELLVSEDHSLALLDPETLEVSKAPAREAVGQCLPTMFRSDDGEAAVYDLREYRGPKSNPLLDVVEVGREVAWMLGVLVGDGWVTQKTPAVATVSLSFGDDGADVAVAWEAAASRIADGAVGYTELPHEFEGKNYTSHRLTLSNTGFAKWIAPMIGHSARGKHLPEGYLHWNRESRRGLFCGLLDTDGSVNWAASGRFSCSFTTTSQRLAEEVRLLGLTLGLAATFTEFENRDQPAYILTFSVSQVQEARWLKLVSARKQAALSKLHNGTRRARGHTDFVPLPPRAREELLDLLRQVGATRRAPNKNKPAFSLYVVLKRGEPTLSREAYESLWSVLDPTLDYSEYLKRWVSVCNAPVSWDLVESAEFTGKRRTMYDITVPGAWTFATADGAIVWDTMALYVPVSAEAVEEAHKMLPSKNLFSPTHFGLLPVPGQDSLLGIFQATKWGTEVKVPEGTTAERAMQMMHDGKLKPTDVILIDGKKTTAGRLSLAALLPAAMQGNEKLLHDSAFRLNKDGVEKMLSTVARDHDKGFATTVDGWKDLGNHLSYLNGSSFSINDFHDGVAMRDRILAPYAAQEKALHNTAMSPRRRDQKIVELYQGAQAELKRVGKAKYDAGGNRVWEWAESGARGNWNQFAQLTLAPVLVEDFARRTVPIPITKSFGEGLSVSEYWASMHGARKGTLDRAQGTREPGAVQKDIVNTTMGIQVTAEDCGATEGKKMAVGHNDIVGRFLAHAVKLGTVDVHAGELITPALVSQARNAGVAELVVRSPLFCRMGKGVCAKCYGHNERGGLHAVGTNLGVIAGQALSEPITQLAMKCSEGVITDGAGVTWAFEDYFEAHGLEVPAAGEVRTKSIVAMLRDGPAPAVVATRLQSHLPDDEMVFIKTRSGHVMAVQKNHPLWVYDANGNAFVKAAGALEPRVDRLRVDRVAIERPTCAMAPLDPYAIGFFLAEGSTRYGNGTPRYDGVAVASVFSQHESFQKHELVTRLRAINGIGTVSSHEKCVEVYDPAFAALMASVVRGRSSYTKRLQPGFNLWYEEELVRLLAGWIDGDGTVFESSGVTVAKIYTSSFVALQQLEIICARLRIRCSAGYVSRPDETVKVKSRHANFFAELRFNEDSRWDVGSWSLRMRAKGEVKFAKHRFIDHDLDPVRKVQVMPKWITPVWDVKTSSQGFTCGMLRNHNTFHTGGVSSAGQSSAVDSFKRVKQLFMVPGKLPDKATIATVGGTIGKIVTDARGGLTVDIEGKAHRVITGHLLDGIKTGAVVHRGDPISTGPLDPHELLEHTKSIGRTRNYITDEATAAYQGTVRQRNVEMVVRGMTNLTEVHNAPPGSPWHQGDLAPLSAVDEHNANATAEGHEVISHTPTLRAMTLVPLSGTEDWMARLNYQRLKDTYTEGAAQGWKSNIHDHPIPGLAHGAEFGLRPPTARTPPPATGRTTAPARR